MTAYQQYWAPSEAALREGTFMRKRRLYRSDEGRFEVWQKGTMRGAAHRVPDFLKEYAGVYAETIIPLSIHD